MPVRGSRLTLALWLGVVVVVILGAGAAVAVSGSQRRPTAAATTVVEPATVAASSTPVARVKGGADVQPAVGPSNNQTVQLSAAAKAQPRAEQVQQLLQAYFDAINNHDYGAWSDVVTTAQTTHQDSDRWLQAYASTVDSSIWVQSLSGTPLRAALRFTSEQDPELAPPDLQVDCIDWTLTYQIDEQDGQLVVGSTVPGTVFRAECG